MHFLTTELFAPKPCRKVRRSVICVVLTLTMLASLSGCSGKRRLSVNPVHGRVTYRGEGISGAIVIFTPTGETLELLKKMRPSAEADAQGNFELKTYVDGDGAPAGSYRVSIIVPSGPGAARTKDNPVAALPTGNKPANIPPSVVQKYEKATTSGIDVILHEGENNLEPFLLTADGKT